MKKNGTARLSLAGAMVAAMCVAYVHAQFGNAPAKLNTVKIADDLYVIHNDFVPGNTTALVTNEVVVLFPAQRTLAAGDMFTYGDDVPELVDYAGGGSAKEWTSTLDSALMLDFNNVVPGHGNVTSKAEMRKFRDSTLRLRNRIHEMIGQKKTRDEIATMLKTE